MEYLVDMNKMTAHYISYNKLFISIQKLTHQSSGQLTPFCPWGSARAVAKTADKVGRSRRYLRKWGSCSRQSGSLSLGSETHAQDPGEGSVSRTEAMRTRGGGQEERQERVSCSETPPKGWPVNLTRPLPAPWGQDSRAPGSVLRNPRRLVREPQDYRWALRSGGEAVSQRPPPSLLVPSVERTQSNPKQRKWLCTPFL